MNRPPREPHDAGGELFDTLATWVAGELAPDERERFEAELRRDPSLRELAEEYRTVHALTSTTDLAPAPCGVTFADIEARLEGAPASVGGTSWTRRAAAAALFVGLLSAGAVGGLWALRGRSAADGLADEPLVLQAIDLDGELRAEPVPLDLALRSWPDFDPRGDQGPRWLSDLADATLLAQIAERPLLVYGSFPGCPLCATLDREVFPQADVLELFERYVPLRLDLSLLPEQEARAMMARGYPFLEVWQPEGGLQVPLFRGPDPTAFLESMHDGLERAEATGEMPDWESVRELARQYDRARVEEQSGRLAEAQGEFRDLARRARGGAYARYAVAGLRRIADGAREGLLEARQAAERDPAEAERLLGRTLERYRDTTFAGDLEAVRGRLQRDGRFPPVVTAFVMADDERS